MASIKIDGREIPFEPGDSVMYNQTGIKVRYDTFDANETLETKLLAGKSG